MPFLKSKAKERPAVTEVKTPDLTSQVLSKLGRPADLYKVNVVHLFGRNYRVNVHRTEGEGMVKRAPITDSFFVVTDETGVIVGGDPITRKYGVKNG